jgi:subtilase family serine protease
MTNVLAKVATCLWLFALLTSPGLAADRFSLDTPVPVSAHLSIIGGLPATNRMNLAIGLPLRNRDALTKLLHQVYDRGSTNFHRYLTPEQFAEQFGPSEQDYQRVKDYAVSNRLEVVGTYGNRAVLDVAGQVSDIENTFQIHLRTYQHPREPRQFYGPDARPSVPAGLPLLYVCGLDNYKSRKSPVPRLSPASLKPSANILNGSG